MKILWALAAGRCSFPGCRVVCVAEVSHADPAVPIGEMAHIVAHSDDGPRGDPTFPVSLRNTYTNLILLCPTHHTLIDKQESTYTVANLREWKVDHEGWVRTRLAEEVPSIGFAELEIVTHGFLAAHGDPTLDLTALPVAEKMARNALTSRVLTYLQMGVAGSREVASFVAGIGHLDPDFGERLRAGFVNLYRSLRSVGFEGDALFLALLEKASGGSDFKMTAAGLAVVGYLFVTCEVFER